MKRNIPKVGIVTIIIYFAVVGCFLITKTEFALTLWELVTILGAIVILFVLLELSNLINISSSSKNIMLVFMSCTCTLTAVAHTVNIAVTRRLIDQGVDVPNYFRIGYWPSVEMAVDYLAWGLFMGLVFFVIGFAIHSGEKHSLFLKKVTILSGILCFLGFFGTLFINENLWYLAPVGYCFGTIAICMQMIKLRKLVII